MCPRTRYFFPRRMNHSFSYSGGHNNTLTDINTPSYFQRPHHTSRSIERATSPCDTRHGEEEEEEQEHEEGRGGDAYRGRSAGGRPVTFLAPVHSVSDGDEPPEPGSALTAAPRDPVTRGWNSPTARRHRGSDASGVVVPVIHISEKKQSPHSPVTGAGGEKLADPQSMISDPNNNRSMSNPSTHPFGGSPHSEKGMVVVESTDVDVPEGVANVLSPRLAQVAHRVHGPFTAALLDLFAVSVRRTVLHEAGSVAGVAVDQVRVAELFLEPDGSLVFIVTVQPTKPEEREIVQALLLDSTFPSTRVYLKQLQSRHVSSSTTPDVLEEEHGTEDSRKLKRRRKHPREEMSKKEGKRVLSTPLSRGSSITAGRTKRKAKARGPHKGKERRALKDESEVGYCRSRSLSSSSMPSRDSSIRSAVESRNPDGASISDAEEHKKRRRKKKKKGKKKTKGKEERTSTADRRGKVVDTEDSMEDSDAEELKSYPVELEEEEESRGSDAVDESSCVASLSDAKSSPERHNRRKKKERRKRSGQTKKSHKRRGEKKRKSPSSSSFDPNEDVEDGDVQFFKNSDQVQVVELSSDEDNVDERLSGGTGTSTPSPSPVSPSSLSPSPSPSRSAVSLSFSTAGDPNGKGKKKTSKKKKSKKKKKKVERKSHKQGSKQVLRSASEEDEHDQEGNGDATDVEENDPMLLPRKKKTSKKIIKKRERRQSEEEEEERERKEREIENSNSSFSSCPRHRTPPRIQPLDMSELTPGPTPLTTRSSRVSLRASPSVTRRSTSRSRRLVVVQKPPWVSPLDDPEVKRMVEERARIEREMALEKAAAAAAAAVAAATPKKAPDVSMPAPASDSGLAPARALFTRGGVDPKSASSSPEMQRSAPAPAPAPVSEAFLSAPEPTPRERDAPPPPPVQLHRTPETFTADKQGLRERQPVPAGHILAGGGGAGDRDSGSDSGSTSPVREHSFSHAIGDGFLLIDVVYPPKASTVSGTRPSEKGTNDRSEVRQLELFFDGTAGTLTGRDVRAYVAEYLGTEPEQVQLRYGKKNVTDRTRGAQLGWSNGSLVEAYPPKHLSPKGPPPPPRVPDPLKTVGATGPATRGSGTPQGWSSDTEFESSGGGSSVRSPLSPVERRRERGRRTPEPTVLQRQLDDDLHQGRCGGSGGSSSSGVAAASPAASPDDDDDDIYPQPYRATPTLPSSPFPPPPPPPPPLSKAYSQRSSSQHSTASGEVHGISIRPSTTLERRRRRLGFGRGGVEEDRPPGDTTSHAGRRPPTLTAPATGNRGLGLGSRHALEPAWGVDDESPHPQPLSVRPKPYV